MTSLENILFKIHKEIHAELNCINYSSNIEYYNDKENFLKMNFSVNKFNVIIEDRHNINPLIIIDNDEINYHTKFDIYYVAERFKLIQKLLNN